MLEVAALRGKRNTLNLNTEEVEKLSSSTLNNMTFDPGYFVVFK